jgi:Ca2+-transporting ATPase
MAGNALRVLGVAYAEVEATAAEPTTFIWLGLVGMADPIRKGTRSLMETFHQAGIDTVMITGDQRQTAYAIGKALNLSHNGPLEVLDSADLVHLDAETIKTLCGRSHIFARVSPAHKLKIVQALQDAGKIVAMTGDGINDAPALKAANVGVAMGHSGTDVAREVADVILEDDDLQTMAIAISRGRTIYSNIRKSVHFLLSTNLSEILVMLAGTSLGIGQPLTAMQLLWLNLVTDIFPGLALALEPPESNVMRQPPRDPSESIIQPAEFRRIAFESILLSVSSLAAYGYGLIHYGISAQASTIAFMSLVMAQLLHAISCRSKTQSLFSRSKRPVNYYLAIALMLSLSLQLLSAIIPGLNHLLDIEPLTLLDSAVIAISAGLPLLINEATKGRGGVRS